MLSALGDEFFASSQVTGEDGRFLFDSIDLYDTTLFWESEIKPGEDGRATVTFFISDKASVYRIIAEGITETGSPVLKTKELWVQAASEPEP